MLTIIYIHALQNGVRVGPGGFSVCHDNKISQASQKCINAILCSILIIYIVILNEMNDVHGLCCCQTMLDCPFGSNVYEVNCAQTKNKYGAFQ